MSFDAVSAWFRHSLTMAWAWLLMVLGIAGSLVLVVLDAMQALDWAAILPAKYAVFAPLIVTVIGFITKLARQRSLS